MADAGTPLVRKLGIREGHRVAVIGAPDGFAAMVQPMPPGARLVTRTGPRSDVVVCFADSMAVLRRRVAAALPSLAVDGGLWLAYPKQASRVATDLTFVAVQQLGLDAGLVDNKSCAVDGTWTALRFVVPLASRPSWASRQPPRPV